MTEAAFTCRYPAPPEAPAPAPCARPALGWLKGALTDNSGRWDVAYISLFGVAVVLGAVLIFACFMQGIEFWRCTHAPTTTLAKGDSNVTSVIACHFDIQSFGIGVAAIAGAFSTSIGALALYMKTTKGEG